MYLMFKTTCDWGQLKDSLGQLFITVPFVVYVFHIERLLILICFFSFLIIDEALTSTLIYAKLESAFEMTAKAYCCLKYCNFCSSKGTSIPTFGSRKVME